MTAIPIAQSTSMTPIPVSPGITRNVNAIIAAENTCRLGKDFPLVSFGITGATPNASYGLLRFTRYRNTLTPMKPSSGTRIAIELEEKYLLNSPA